MNTGTNASDTKFMREISEFVVGGGKPGIAQGGEWMLQG